MEQTLKIAFATAALLLSTSLARAEEPKIFDIAGAAREPMTEGLTRRAIHTKQASMAVFDFKAGAKVPEHQHPNEQVTYIVSGHVKVTVEGKEYDVRAGQVIAIPPNKTPSFVAIEDTVDIDFFTPVRADWVAGTANYFGGEKK